MTEPRDRVDPGDDDGPEVGREAHEPRRLDVDPEPPPGLPGLESRPQEHEEAEEPEAEGIAEDGEDGEDGEDWGAAAPPVAKLEPEAEPDEEPVDEHAAGELDVPDAVELYEGEPRGGRRRVGIVVSRFNGDVTNRLLRLALLELEDSGVPASLVTVMPVPGAFELPLGAMALAKTRRYACVVALGCVVRGETPHFGYVAGEAASGLQLAALETGVPVSFGVLTVETVEQAEARLDRAREAVRSALEMADVFAQLRQAAAG